MRGLLPDMLTPGFLIEFAALFFLLLFTVIVWRTFNPVRRHVYEEIRGLPLSDGLPLNKPSPDRESPEQTELEESEHG